MTRTLRFMTRHAPVRDERGSSLVLGLSIVFTMLLLVTLLQTQVIHLSEQTGKDKTRSQVFHIAEAGLDRALTQLAYNQSYAGTPAPETVTAGGVTLGSFTTTVTDIGGNQRLIVSTGTVPKPATTRRLELTVALAPLGGFDYAIYSNTTMSLNQHLINNGGQFSNGSMTLQQHTTTNGDLISPGNITTANNSTINGKLWTGGNAVVANGTVVNGSVYAAGTATVRGTVTGDVYARTIVVDGGTIKGTQVTLASGYPAPASRTLPAFTFSPLNFPDLVLPSPTTTALFNTTWSASNGSMAGTYRVSDVAGTLTQPNQQTTLSGDLTIITDRPLSLSRDFRSSSTSPRRLIIISTYSGIGDGVTFSNNITLPANISVFVYAMDTVRFTNQKNLHGIVYANEVVQDQYFTITYEPQLREYLTGKGFVWDLSSAGAYELEPGIWRDCTGTGGSC